MTGVDQGNCPSTESPAAQRHNKSTHLTPSESHIVEGFSFETKRQIVHGLVTCVALPVLKNTWRVFVAPTSWRGLRRVWRRSVWPTWPSEWNRVRSVALGVGEVFWRAVVSRMMVFVHPKTHKVIAKEEWSNSFCSKKPLFDFLDFLILAASLHTFGGDYIPGLHW